MRDDKNAKCALVDTKFAVYFRLGVGADCHTAPNLRTADKGSTNLESTLFSS
jgi:hypothetical protein